MIELKGLNGESVVFDGATVAKFRHNGLDEAARNPVSTFREVQIRHHPGKRGKEGRYEIMVVLTSFMSLQVPESEKETLDELVAQLQAASSA